MNCDWMRVAVLSASLCAGLSAQGQQETIGCELAMVDLAAVKLAGEAIRAGASLEEVLTQVGDAEQVLGDLTVPIEEEAVRHKSFPIPGTEMYVTAAILVTDEVMPGDAVVMALAVDKTAIENTFDHEEASSVQTVMVDFPFISRLSKRIRVHGKAMAFSLMCTTLPMDEVFGEGRQSTAPR